MVIKFYVVCIFRSVDKTNHFQLPTINDRWRNNKSAKWQQIQNVQQHYFSVSFSNSVVLSAVRWWSLHSFESHEQKNKKTKTDWYFQTLALQRAAACLTGHLVKNIQRSVTLRWKICLSPHSFKSLTRLRMRCFL